MRKLTSLAGAVTDTYEYDAFGNLVNSTGSTPNVYLYRGEQYDPDLGLYYLRARYYNPATGRFMSKDPEGGEATSPQSLHKYLYAGGDPVNAKDPTGRADLTEYFQAIKKVLASPASQVIAGTLAIACLALSPPHLPGSSEVYDVDKSVLELECYAIGVYGAAVFLATVSSL